MINLSSTKKGLIVGVAMVVMAAVFQFVLKWPANGFNQFALYFLYAAGIFWAISSYEKAHGTGSPKLLFAEGFKAFIVMTLLMVLFTFVYYKMHPEVLETAIIENNKLISAQQNHTPQEIDENAQKLRSIFMPMMISTTTLKYLVLGAIFSVINAMILRKRN